MTTAPAGTVAYHGEIDEPVAALPASVLAALQAAQQVIQTRPGGATRGGLGSTEQVKDLLSLLHRSAGLRAAVKCVVDKPSSTHRDGVSDAVDGTGLAEALLHRDAETSSRAGEAVLTRIAANRREASRQRRYNRRKRKPDAAERAASRRTTQLEETRAERDRARGQAEQNREEVHHLREQVQALEAELETARSRLSNAEHRLDAQRFRLAEPRHAAAALQTALAEYITPQDQPPPLRTSENTEPRGAAGQRVLEEAIAALPEEGRQPGRTWFPRMLEALARPLRLQTATELGLRVEVLGAGAEIGGSCVLVEAGGTRLLVDCGTRPGGTDQVSLAPPKLDRALDGPLHAVVVTHAHNDHAGWVPKLVAVRPNLPVLATAATGDLLGTMWFDSAKVLDRKVREAGWSGDRQPPYTQTDVTRAVDALREIPFDRPVQVGALTVQLFPAGHIVGAAGVVVTAGDQRVVVTGDVSARGQLSVGGLLLPPESRGAQLMLLESTYADARTFQSRPEVVEAFVRTVRAVVERGGVALVPAFALGRAQEIALLCRQHLPEVPVLVDGLARDIAEVYQRHDGPHGAPLRVFGDQVRPVTRGRTPDEVASFRGGVVVATSGMLNQGPAVSWARRVLPDPDSALMVVGYQDEESPGGKLLRLAEAGGGVFALPAISGGWHEVQVQAQVDRYQLGAHANADELASIAAEANPQQLMLVHGEARAQGAFAGRLRARGQRTTATGVWTPVRTSGGLGL